MRLRREVRNDGYVVRRAVAAGACVLLAAAAVAGASLRTGHSGPGAPAGRPGHDGGVTGAADRVRLAAASVRDRPAVLAPGLGRLLAGVPASLVARLSRLLAGAPAAGQVQPPAWLLAGRSPQDQALIARAFAHPAGSGCFTVQLPGQPAEGFVAGFSNVTKLRGAASLGPGLIRLVVGSTLIFCPNQFLDVAGTATLSFHGQPEFPPVRSTFLTFGFAPVTATLRISQVGKGKLDAIGPVTSSGNLVLARLSLVVSVLTVTVNGVPLAVGPRCGTSRPVNAVLAGFDPTNQPGPGYYTIDFGGPLTGTITFPPFTGCGVNDNLNPILTASISGTQNFVKMTQGRLCSLGQPVNTKSQCPPPVPTPLR